jgi:cob(I)alamin adenosyltransferase
VNEPLAPRIYTKTGDTGETGLFDGTRVSKADPRVEAYGAVDELCAWLGLVRARLEPGDLGDFLTQIQRELFAVGAQLADPRERIASRVTKSRLGAEHVARLESGIDDFTREVPALRNFILPGGSDVGALLHVARTVCRRAERRVVGLGGDVGPDVVVYLNRLSDLIFVLARVANARAGVPDVEW